MEKEKSAWGFSQADAVRLRGVGIYSDDAEDDRGESSDLMRMVKRNTRLLEQRAALQEELAGVGGERRRVSDWLFISVLVNLGLIGLAAWGWL